MPITKQEGVDRRSGAVRDGDGQRRRDGSAHSAGCRRITGRAGRIGSRTCPSTRVRDLIRAHTEPPAFGFLGRARVNVLELNLALDETLGAPKPARRQLTRNDSHV